MNDREIPTLFPGPYLEENEALQESEERFRTMADGLPLIVWVHGAGGEQQFVNRTFCEFFGVTEAEMRGGSWELLLHPDEGPAYRDEFLACAAERRPFHAEVRVRRYDGEWRWIESWGRPRLSRSGEFLGFVGTSADITERKRMEQALNESEARFRATFEQAPLGVAHVGLDGSFLRVNNTLCGILGYACEELQRMTFQDITHPDDLEADLAYAGRLAAGEIDSYQMEKRYVRRDGNTVWALLTGALLRDEAGRPLHFVAMVEDISERRRMQEDLRESEAWLRLAMDAGRLGTWDWNPQTGSLSWSEGHYTLLGYRVGEVTPSYEAFETRIHPDDLARQQETIQAAMREHREYQCEYRVCHPNGSQHWIEARGRFEVDEAGRPVRSYGVILDVDDKKRAEEAMRREAEALAEADRAKTNFLAVLGHELRNPLNSIHLATYVLSDKIEGGPVVERNLRTLRNQTEQMTRIVNDLLDASRITRGKLEFQPVALDLVDAVRRAVDVVQPAADEGGRDITLSLPQTPLPIQADPARLEQVLVNVLGNAVKFTAPGGLIRVSCRTEGTQAVVAVEDDGAGIAPEVLPLIFGMFAQAEPGRRGQTGLGIGLALSRQLVEMHGGTIMADSAGLGHGCAVMIRLPLAEAIEG